MFDTCTLIRRNSKIDLNKLTLFSSHSMMMELQKPILTSWIVETLQAMRILPSVTK